MSKKTTIICDNCGRPVLEAARIEVVYYQRIMNKDETANGTFDFCSNACAEASLKAWQGGAE